jgi:hypothetical protein
MNFMERWFGLSPDGGSGSFEVSILVSIIVATLAVAFRRKLYKVLAKCLSGI